MNAPPSSKCGLRIHPNGRINLWHAGGSNSPHSVSLEPIQMTYSRTITAAAATLLLLLTAVTAHSGNLEKAFIAAGLVDIHTIDATIQVDLVNADPAKNYFRENFYGNLNKAYLRPEVARKLAYAQQLLKARRPDYSLLIMDAARPRSVSRAMYDKMKGTRFEKFVANPSKGSMHNYGIAVDITIVDSQGNQLDMGLTPFYKSTLQFYWLYAKNKLKSGPTKAQQANRQLLADTMAAAGFIPLPFEWWHFNGVPNEEARRRFDAIE